MTIITTAGFLGHPFGCPFFVARWVLGRDSVSQKRYTALAPCAPRAPWKYALRKCSTGIYIKHPTGMPVERVFEGAVPQCRAARQAFHSAKTLHGSACLRCSCSCRGRFYVVQHIIEKIDRNMLYNISKYLRMS